MTISLMWDILMDVTWLILRELSFYKHVLFARYMGMKWQSLNILFLSMSDKNKESVFV